MPTVIPAPYTLDPFFNVPTWPVETTVGEVELPILYYESSNVFTLFAADPDAVAAKLAGTGLRPALHYGKRPIVAIASYEYRLSAIGPYNEVGVGILAYPDGMGTTRPLTGWRQLVKSADRRELGVYVIDLPVTTQDAFVAGSQIWSYPKFVAPITYETRRATFSSVTTDPDDGSTILDMSGSLLPLFRTPQMPLVLYSHHNGSLLRTNVEPRNGMTANPPGLRITVGTSRHRMANNLRDLGLDGARALAVASTDKFQSRLNAGVAYRPHS